MPCSLPRTAPRAPTPLAPPFLCPLLSARRQLAMVHYITEWHAADADEAPPAAAAEGDGDGDGNVTTVAGGTAFYRERHSGASQFGPATCSALQAGGGSGSFYCKGSLVHRCARGQATGADCACAERGARTADSARRV